MMQTPASQTLPFPQPNAISAFDPANPLARNAAAPLFAAAPAHFTAPLHQIAQCLVPGDVVFDIGANTGDKAASLLTRGVKVVCIEPQPACVAVLNNRFRAHPGISIVPKGLGSRPGIMPMHINSRAPVLSTLSTEWMKGRFANETWDQTLDVAITTLDEMVRQHGSPRYAKIDVEGFEYEVLCGLSRRVGVISFEFTEEFFGHAERSLAYLQNLGYSRFNFSLGEQVDFALDQWADSGRLCAVLKDVFSRYSQAWGDIYAN